MEPCKAISGSSIAAVGDGVPPINVYYQGPDKAIYEKKDRGVWEDPQQLVCDAIALTAISAISLKSALFICILIFLVPIMPTDMDELRIYYQGNDHKIRERCYAAGSWTDGYKFPIDVPPRTRIATVSWKDESEIRLYVQDNADNIVEWCYDDTRGWRGTDFRTMASPGTDIAATSTVLEGVSLIWLFYHGVRGNHEILQERICYGTGKQVVWTVARDVCGSGV